ncbi:hypothetical protein THAOC_01278 [Thalassiosira oceanica]|uniref:ABC transporter domain-containing protein n=1 Tax=Thalassiosira oceanica TaxID=159749 RepID=K0TIP2_THAOC|nr:hypothetical protein THAOC_01278 [Thalassiosira oceanica]|eukprot:EJK76929.1 hypothetical protein THAOC_01278 [Thalassiosira oceanica]
MSTPSEDDLRGALASVLLKDGGDEGVVDGIDGDIIEYLAGMLAETEMDDVEESVGPFLEGYGCDETLIRSCCDAVTSIGSVGSGGGPSSSDMHVVNGSRDDVPSDGPAKLKQGVVSMSAALTDQTEDELDAQRYMWGQENRVAAMTNAQRDAHDSTVSAKDRRKARKELEAARREYEARMAVLQAQEEGDAGKASVSNMIIPDYRSGRNEKDIHVRNVSLSLDNGTCLLDDGELKFAHRRRYGLVGKNGVGKTTLLKAIAAFEVEKMPRHHRILHVRQEIRAAGGDISVLRAVMDADVERNTLIAEERELLGRLEGGGDAGGDGDAAAATKARLERLKAEGKGDDESFGADLKRLDEVYARLQALGSDSAESRASVILSGLQFTPAMQSGPTSALSGGWRMRVALAAALFIEPDLLMLDALTLCDRADEPLRSRGRPLAGELPASLSSHGDRRQSRQVLPQRGLHGHNRVQESQADLLQGGLRHVREDLGRERQKPDARVSGVQGQTRPHDGVHHEVQGVGQPRQARAVQSQGRGKDGPRGAGSGRGGTALEVFHTEPRAARPAHHRDRRRIEVNFGVDLDSRIGILGPNGAGKSTLLNLIMDRLTPNRGSISRNGNLRIGHFTQHSADKFDLQLSAVENMLNTFQESDDQIMRSFLGKFQIQNTDALKPMMMLSGGQKSRVAFASLAYQKPHVIIMDEPTNHLDMESIDALVEAVKDFRGGLIVVSHDQHFITNTCGELWVVGEGRVTRFRGDFDDYKKETLKRTEKRVAESVKSLSMINN